MLNPPLVLVSALFFLALVSVLYLTAWLLAMALLRLGRGRLSHAGAKRVLMTALVLPPVLALLPTVSGATLRHMHDGGGGGAAHHTQGCRAMFEGFAALERFGGGGSAASILVNTATWGLLLVGAFLVARLVRATVRLERGILPFLNAPSARLAQSLKRVQAGMPRFPADRFFECPIPAGYSSVLGFLRARCVLSQAFVASASVSDEELDGVVAHEAGHLLGRDVGATFVAGVLNCLFFFLRPVRLLARQWRKAAELAADDAAVAATGNPLAVAAAILKVSGSLPTSGSAAFLTTRLPAVTLPFADESACPPSVRVERLLAQAQRAAAFAPQSESRLQIFGGWAATGALAALGAALLLSAEAACVSHCTLEAVSRIL